uniref:Uncharacterized protein n=1 Tax=Octopus bimaculoides TaxID=37653 RepID=A0A0L8FTD5_OCTBM
MRRTCLWHHQCAGVVKEERDESRRGIIKEVQMKLMEEKQVMEGANEGWKLELPTVSSWYHASKNYTINTHTCTLSYKHVAQATHRHTQLYTISYTHIHTLRNHTSQRHTTNYTKEHYHLGIHTQSALYMHTHSTIYLDTPCKLQLQLHTVTNSKTTEMSVCMCILCDLTDPDNATNDKNLEWPNTRIHTNIKTETDRLAF